MSVIASFRVKLEPLLPFLNEPAVTEIAVNRPGTLWVARQGQRFMEEHTIERLDYPLLESLAELTGAFTHQQTGQEKPLLSASIPIDLDDATPDAERGSYRIQLVLPPAVEARTIGLCIRKHMPLDFTLADYSQQGAFRQVNTPVSEGAYSDEVLKQLYVSGQWEEFLRGAVKAHKNIVISAGTNAGKTTLLNALLKEIPLEERVVTIEDSREVHPPQRNCLHLLYSRGEQGVANVSAVDLLQAMLRLTPDRPIMGELRGEEAFSYLELLNSGHTGSITTIHADSTSLMYERLVQMVMRFGAPLGKQQIIDYARSLIQVVVQFKRASDGRRYISEILYDA